MRPTFERLWSWLSWLLLLALAAVMFSTFLDYGMTGDEGVQHRYGRRLLRWYATRGADASGAADTDVSMYGGFFEIVAEAATLVSPLDPYETRHLVNVAFALVAFWAVLRMGAYLGGPTAGLLALLFLALTPPFYGHSFNNPKDIPFAATFALALYAILRAGQAWPRLAWPRLIAAGIAIGLAAGVRVAGIVLLGQALLLWSGLLLLKRARSEGELSSERESAARLGAAWLVVVIVAWTVMVAFWPWAQRAPLRNPPRAFRAFSHFWETMVVFYDGRLVPSGEVSRFYLPTWFALTLPEVYLVALVLAAVMLVGLLRRRPLATTTRVRMWEAAWLAGAVGLPVVWVVITRVPLYDGLRHFLFVMPVVAVLSGVAVAAFLGAGFPTWVRGMAALAVAAPCALTLADMIALHPYEAVYFNRLVAGGLARAALRYDSDYWCLSYKEGAEWLVTRYAGAECSDRIRVAGHSILLQTEYYLRKSDEAGRIFKAVSVDDNPNFVLATTRYGDHQRTPGTVVHLVERQHAPLLYVFEVKPPACRTLGTAP